MKITLHAKAAQYTEGGFEFHPFSSVDMDAYGYIACDTVEVEFHIPPRDVLVSGAVAAYRAEQQRIRAEAQGKVQELDEAIQRLLCIEHKPAAEDATA